MNRSFGSEEFLEEERLDDDPLEGTSERNQLYTSEILPDVNQTLNDSVDYGQKNFVGETALNDADKPSDAVATESYVFSFKGTFFRKLFRSQLRPGQMSSRDIFGDSVDDVLRCIWSTAKHHVNRKVQFEDEVPSWCDKEHPDFEDIGATSTRDDSSLASELCASHPDIEGHFSSWLLWVNYVNSSPAHERDRLKLASAPPLELAKYFRWAAVSESARLQAMHRGMVVANVVNTGWTKEVAGSILQGVSNRLSAMKARGSAGSEVFDAMESTLQPVESDLSKILASRVGDCDDTDHA